MKIIKCWKKAKSKEFPKKSREPFLILIIWKNYMGVLAWSSHIESPKAWARGER